MDAIFNFVPELLTDGEQALTKRINTRKLPITNKNDFLFNNSNFMAAPLELVLLCCHKCTYPQASSEVPYRAKPLRQNGLLIFAGLADASPIWLTYDIGMGIWKSQLLGSPNRISKSVLWTGLAVLIFGIGIGLGWLLMGFPGQRFDTRTINFDQPMQIMHNQMLNHLPPQTTNLPDQGGSSRAVLPKNYYDFGVVEQSGTVSRSFKIANQGDAPLVISTGYTTCTCTTAVLTSSIIPPGKTSLVTVTFDSLHAKPGTLVRRGVVLGTNDPLMPQIEIWIQAKIIQ